MNNKKTSFFAGDFTRLAYRFALIFALIVPLADTVLISPACGAVLANVGDGVLYEILSRLSELAVTAAFLSMCALVVCAVFADLRALALRLLLLEGLSFIFIGVLLKSAMLWVCAALDECLFTELGSFALSNYTLAQINDQLLVWWSMISCFMNVLMLCVVVLAGFVAAALKVRSVKATGRKLSNDTLVAQLPQNAMINRYIALPIVVYLIAQLAFCIVDTVDSVSLYGAPALVSEYLFLILPFVYQAAYAAVGYFVCQYIAFVMISRLGKKNI